MRSLIAIQEGQISIERIKALEAMVRRLYAEHVSSDALTIIWNVADKKHTITDRQWSRSSTMSVAVPDGFDKDKREAFLSAVDKAWREITGQHPDQTSFGAFDEARFDHILKSNLTRFSPVGKFMYLARLMTRAYLSKRRHGVMITRFNQ